MKSTGKIVLSTALLLLIFAGPVFSQSRDTLFVVAIVPDSPETAAGIEFGLVKDKELITDFADMMVTSGIVRKKSVILLDGKNATRGNFVRELEKVNPGRNDLFCVFVTCHGGMWGQSKSQFFALQESSVNRDELNDFILGKKSEFKMLITDACANTSDNYQLKTQKTRAGLSSRGIENLKKLFNYKGYFSMSASTEGKVAWIYEFGGAFIYSFLKNVMMGMPPDDWYGVVDKTRRLVDEINDQHPRAYSIPTLSGTDERPDSEFDLYNPDLVDVDWEYDKNEEKNALKGVWEFNNKSDPLKASTGKDLVLSGSHTFIEGTGPGDGAVRINRGSYFTCDHGLKPDTGSKFVNRYSIVFDVKIHDPEIFYCLFQTNEGNVNDGEFFIRKFDGLIGISAVGYSRKSIKPGNWYRLAVTVDNIRKIFNCYLDGERILIGVPQSKDGQFSLGKTILFFADDDGEDGTIDVSRIRLYDTALHQETVKNLGRLGPEEESVFITTTEECIGLWEFNDTTKPLKAAIGNDLVLHGKHNVVSGTMQGDNAVRIGEGSYYSLAHNMTPESPAKYVNKYTIIFDIRIPDLTRYYALFQTNEDNMNDAEVFIGVNDGKIGVSATGYSKASLKPGTWARVSVAVDTTKGMCDYYMDGEKVHQGEKQMLDGRFSLSKKLLLFADDNGEDGMIDVSRVALYNYALTAGEIKKLGSVDSSAIQDDVQDDTDRPVYDRTVAAQFLKGLWEFNDSGNPLKASKGRNLVLKGKHSIVKGAANNDSAVRIEKGSYYQAILDSSPEPGEIAINRYSIVMDVKIPNHDTFYTLFQTNENNQNDGDVFIKKESGTIGVYETGYSDTPVTPGKWNRIVVAVDAASGIFDYYLNGNRILKGKPQVADGRFSLDTKLLFFADDDGEDGTIEVTTIAFYNTALSAALIRDLGGL